MVDRRVRVDGRVPHVGDVPRARRLDGGWYRKRSDAGKSRKKGDCFIATICMNNDEVRIFRNWRDKRLLKSRTGRRFMDFYYEVSPPIARFISDKPLFQKIFRMGLIPIKHDIERRIR